MDPGRGTAGSTSRTGTPQAGESSFSQALQDRAASADRFGLSERGIHGPERGAERAQCTQEPGEEGPAGGRDGCVEDFWVAQPAAAQRVHMPFLGRVYVERPDRLFRFCWAKAATSAEQSFQLLAMLQFGHLFIAGTMLYQMHAGRTVLRRASRFSYRSHSRFFGRPDWEKVAPLIYFAANGIFIAAVWASASSRLAFLSTRSWAELDLSSCSR